MVENRSNYVNLYPSLDALQEFKVQSGNYSAEYGGNAGANINLPASLRHQPVSRQAFSNSSATTIWTRAASSVRSRCPRTCCGATSSAPWFPGPIRRDRTFFMVGYEGVRSAKDTPGTNIVFTPAMRPRRPSPAFSTPVTDPLNNNTPFAGNMIPANRLNPVALNLLNYMPQPNTLRHGELFQRAARHSQYRPGPGAHRPVFRLARPGPLPLCALAPRLSLHRSQP